MILWYRDVTWKFDLNLIEMLKESKFSTKRYYFISYTISREKIEQKTIILLTIIYLILKLFLSKLSLLKGINFAFINFYIEVLRY